MLYHAIVVTPLSWNTVFSHGLKPPPPVCLDVISLVASRCGYYTGHIEQRAAQSFAVHVATPRGLVKRLQHRPPPCVQPVVPLRERHCRRPRGTPRRCTDQAPSRDLGHPRAHTGEDTTPSPHHATGCAAHPAIRFSPPGHGFSTLDARWKPLISHFRHGFEVSPLIY